MKPILIAKDEAKIIEAHHNLDTAVTDFQRVYDLFKTRDIELSISEIRGLLFYNWTHVAAAGYLESFTTEKVMAKMGAAAIGGIPIKKEKLRDMIEVEDIKPLEAEIKRLGARYAATINKDTAIDISLLRLIDGTISKADNANKTIEEKFSLYTQNQRGNEVVLRIQQTMNYLEDYRQFLGKAETGDPLHNVGRFAVPGIKFTGDLSQGIKEGSLVIDLAFIRRQEALYDKKRA